MGPATLKALLPVVHSLEAAWSGDVYQRNVANRVACRGEEDRIGRHQAMKTFKNQEKCFKSHPMLDWEPVQVLKGGGDVFPEPGVSEDSGS